MIIGTGTQKTERFAAILHAALLLHEAGLISASVQRRPDGLQAGTIRSRSESGISSNNVR